MMKLSEFIERISAIAWRMICKIFHREATESGSEGFFQFVKFGIVGLSNTIISYLIYTFGLLGIRRIVSFRYDYLAAQVLAFVISVFWSYIWNSKMVFSLEKGEKRPFWRSWRKSMCRIPFPDCFSALYCCG